MNNLEVLQQALSAPERAKLEEILALDISKTRFDIERAQLPFDRSKIQLAAILDNLFNWEGVDSEQYVMTEEDLASPKEHWKSGQTVGWVFWYQVWVRLGTMHGKEFNGTPGPFPL